MKLRQITPDFVDEIPRELDPGKLYICCRYRAVKHLCACGCGVAINTPLHPTGWRCRNQHPATSYRLDVDLRRRFGQLVAVDWQLE